MRTRLLALAICWFAAAAPAQNANPYAPALTVNDAVVTRYDIGQRVLLLDALGASGDLNALAVEQLTEDRVKVQAARTLGIELPPDAIALGLEEFATARGLTMEDVTEVLETRGIDQQTMDDFVESGLMWREVIGSRFRARATPTEAELDAALELSTTQPRETMQLAEIALPFAERGEAETLALADQLHRELTRGASFAALAREYSRSESAERGGNLEPMPSAGLPAAIRTQVLLLAPGQVTRPVPISGGVAILKLLSIRQERPDPNAPPPDEAAREALRRQLFAERIASFGQGYLQELLGDALIVERWFPAVALTLGDPAGIGGEIALKAWAELRDRLPFFLIGDAGHMAGLARAAGLAVRPIAGPEHAAAAMAEGLPVLDHPLPRKAPPGRPDPANAPAVVEIIARGVELVRSGRAGALCTNPIHKKALRDGAGFAFPGHTEYLAHLSGATLPVMMLASPMLRVVPVTVHMALADVPRALTADLLEATLRITHAALLADFGIAAPRIAVAGLNPHAGESGALGGEELEVIAPVLARLSAEGLGVTGPHSADTLFHARARARYDAAVCMYHDQALIPLKTLDFDHGVNVTLGLDFVRTSPDHGTAYDLAGTMRADPSSLIAALELARAMAEARAARA